MSEITLRRADPDDARSIAQVRVDAWRTTYKGMIPDAYLAAMSVDDSTSLWLRVLTSASNRANVFVAANGVDVVGFAAGNLLAEPKHGLDAELTAIYLRRDHQRTGIGRRLVGAVVAAEHARRERTSHLVIAGNKERARSTSVSARNAVEQPFQWDGMDLVEVGWRRDLGARGGLAPATEKSNA